MSGQPPPLDGIWDNVPDAKRVDISKMTPEQLERHLETYIDEKKAYEIVMRIDGSASDYSTNMRRITQILDGIAFGFGMAMKIIIVA